jgi:hypothetical protein
MAKKELKGSKKAVEVEQRDEDVEENDDGVDEASTRLSAAQQRRARMRERIAAASTQDREEHDHHDDHAHGHDHHDEEEVDTSNDPSWWVPHSVLGALVVVGILGFFGAFNSVAAKLGYKGMPGLAAASHDAHDHDSHKSEPPKSPEPRPAPTPNQQAPSREMFAAKHLLVMYKGSQRAPENVTRSKEEAKARAEEAHKKAKAGTKFEDLVKEYSDEPGAGQRGGDLGKFPKGRMVGPFQDGLEKTKIGEISDIVETPFGYHVILRMAVPPPGAAPPGPGAAPH